MNADQKNILWIGLFLVVVYLFTDIRVRDTLFNRGSSATPATTTSFTVFTGSPMSTGNGQSATGNQPTVTLTSATGSAA